MTNDVVAAAWSTHLQSPSTRTLMVKMRGGGPPETPSEIMNMMYKTYFCFIIGEAAIREGASASTCIYANGTALYVYTRISTQENIRARVDGQKDDIKNAISSGFIW